MKASEIKCIRVLSTHLRNINVHQDPQDIKNDIFNLAEQLENLIPSGINTHRAETIQEFLELEVRQFAKKTSGG